MLERCAVWILVLIGSAAGCTDGREQSLPEMPAVAVEDFPASVGAAVRVRLERANDNPEDAQANGELGMFLHAHKQLDSASILYRRAEALSDGEFRWSYLLGVVEHQNGSSDRAAEAFRRSLSKRSYAPAAIRLAEALSALERDKEAREALEDSLQIDRDQAAAYYALGRALLDLGETGEAKALLTRAIELSPQSGAAYYSLGLAHRDGGDQASAEHLLGLAEKYSQTQPPIDDPILAQVEEISADEHYFLNLGRSLEGRGLAAEAIEAYQRALGLNPNMATAHANLVGSYGRLGEFEKAEAHYRAAAKVNPKLEELHNNWGVAQAMRDNPTGAADAFQKALDLNPQSADAHANLGVTLMQLGDERAAVRHLTAALANDPGNRTARLQLGGHELEAGRAAEAIKHLEQALQGAPDRRFPFILYALSNAYLQQGMEREAMELKRRALAAAESFGIDELAAEIRESSDLDR